MKNFFKKHSEAISLIWSLIKASVFFSYFFCLIRIILEDYNSLPIIIRIIMIIATFFLLFCLVLEYLHYTSNKEIKINILRFSYGTRVFFEKFENDAKIEKFIIEATEEKVTAEEKKKIWEQYEEFQKSQQKNQAEE